MKKTAILFSVLILTLFSTMAYAHVSTSVDGYKVTFHLEGGRPKVGNNNITVTIEDIDGKKITDATVEVYYYMPVMPSMEDTVKAEVKGESYHAVINLAMDGVWQIIVRFNRPGEKLVKAVFKLKI